MALKVKLFSTTQNNLSSLEDQVNSWISYNQECNVKDIKVAFAEHSILMVVMYEESGISRNVQNLPTKEAPKMNFQEALSSYSQKHETTRTTPSTPRPTPSNNATPNIPGGIEEISPSSIKPGRLIQNNYNKYTKTNNPNISEADAFSWD